MAPCIPFSCCCNLACSCFSAAKMSIDSSRNIRHADGPTHKTYPASYLNSYNQSSQSMFRCPVSRLIRSCGRCRDSCPRETPAISLPLHHKFVSVRTPESQESSIRGDTVRVVRHVGPLDGYKGGHRNSRSRFQFIQAVRSRVVRLTEIGETHKDFPLFGHSKSSFP